MTTPTVSEQIAATAAAFDSVAPTYDGPQGNNQLIQRMREIVWERVTSLVDEQSTLLDLGCGTGIDAQHFAELGHDVIATDVSPAMVARAAQRGLEADGRISTYPIGAHDLDSCDIAPGSVDLAYSNFGPLNCVPDLGDVGRSAAELVRPGGHALFTVMGRCCPWEMAHYARRRRGSRIVVRYRRNSTPVGMNGQTIWTRYFTPRAFVREWVGDSAQWDLQYYESLSLFVPPPYLDEVARSHPRLFEALVTMDRVTARWPLLREMGDHFLVVMRRR